MAGKGGHRLRHDRREWKDWKIVAKKETGEKPICQNKRARINYFIDETYEAGIALVGTEVKALRDGRANLKDSYALIKEGELFLYDVHISPYSHGNRENHNPLRVRKLLMHRQEIKRLYGKSQERGLALIPLRMYFRNGKVKVEIGVGRGRSSTIKGRTSSSRRTAGRWNGGCGRRTGRDDGVF